MAGRAATVPIISVSSATTSITIGAHTQNRSPPSSAMSIVRSSSTDLASVTNGGTQQQQQHDLPNHPIGVTEIGLIPPPPMFSSLSPMLPSRGATSHSEKQQQPPPPTHGIQLAHLNPLVVSSSSPNMLASVGNHDLSELQQDGAIAAAHQRRGDIEKMEEEDDDNVLEESVDDSDSERDVSAASKQPHIFLYSIF